jgi:hypothetical protein
MEKAVHLPKSYQNPINKMKKRKSRTEAIASKIYGEEMLRSC